MSTSHKEVELTKGRLSLVYLSIVQDGNRSDEHGRPAPKVNIVGAARSRIATKMMEFIEKTFPTLPMVDQSWTLVFPDDTPVTHIVENEVVDMMKAYWEVLDRAGFIANKLQRALCNDVDVMFENALPHTPPDVKADPAKPADPLPVP